MSKITGRPKKANKLEKKIQVMMTSKQFEVIQKKAAQAHLNIPGFMREAANKAQVNPRWTPGEVALIKHIIGMANDLHQLSETAKKEGALDAMQHFVKYRDQIDFVIERLREDK